MNTRAKVVIGALAAVVAALTVALGIVLASGDGGGDSNSARTTGGPGYGMMGNTDWSAMQDYMRRLIGDGAYDRMIGQMRQQGWVDGCATSQMYDYMRGVMGDNAYNAMVEHMRQTWGDDWQDMMGSGMWGMMGWGACD